MGACRPNFRGTLGSNVDNGISVVFAGDSIMLGSTGFGIGPESIELVPNFHFTDMTMAVAGTGMYDVDNGILTHPNGIDHAVAAGVIDRLIFFDNSGTNNVRGGDATALMQTYKSEIVTRGHAAGCEVVLCTIPVSSGLSGTNESHRVALNAWLMAGSSGADFVVDVDSLVPNVGSLFDGLHLTEAQAQAAAALFVSVVGI